MGMVSVTPGDPPGSVGSCLTCDCEGALDTNTALLALTNFNRAWSVVNPRSNLTRLQWVQFIGS